jgi:tRNA(fMet)-specific endonuclease VapC
VKYLLDTDTCINILRGKPAYIAKAQHVTPDDLAVSSITRYELLYGALSCESKRRLNERNKVERFLDAVHEIPFSREMAEHAAEIRHELEEKGSGIGPMDILIAATARATKLAVITDNLREFSRVQKLHCQSWK